MLALEQAAQVQRQAVRQLLEDPRTGACLLATVEWLESPSHPADPTVKPSPALSEWARKRLQRLYKKLEKTEHAPTTLDGQHRLRILAKRLRYGVEALRNVLPVKQAQQWQAHAAQLQGRLGAARDVAQAAALAEQLQADPVLQAFLQGVVVGQTAASPR